MCLNIGTPKPINFPFVTDGLKCSNALGLSFWCCEGGQHTSRSHANNSKNPMF